MSQFASWKEIQLKAKLNPADTTLTADIDVWVTKWRLYFVNDNQEEWISFTWVSASGSNYSYTWLTRWLSQTADPATAWTGKTWLAWNTWALVLMHDQIIDKQNGSLVKVYADETARDADLTSPSNGMTCYVTSLWLFTDYIWWAWTNRATWSTPNASETVAWKVEIATDTETQNWTDTWWTGAKLVAVPSEIWKAVQNQSYIYDEDTGAADAYVITLSPAPTTYTEWMRISVKIWVWNTNTWASTINVNSLWTKDIKDRDWDVLVANQLMEGQVYDLIYDWTQFKLITIEKASDSEVLLWTDNIKYLTSKQTKDNYDVVLPWTSVTYLNDTTWWTTASWTYTTVNSFTPTQNSILYTSYRLDVWAWSDWYWRILVDWLVYMENLITWLDLQTYTGTVYAWKWIEIEFQIKLTAWTLIKMDNIILRWDK